MNKSEESAQDFLTDLQRLALEAFPDVLARPAAAGRPAVVAENRLQERNQTSQRSLHQWNASQDEEIPHDVARGHNN